MKQREFLQSVSDRLRCDQDRAESVTFVVLRELRGQLTEKEADDVSAQLSHELKEMWESDFGRIEKPDRMSRNELISRVRAGAVLLDEREAERAIHAVFKTLQLALGSPHGTEGEAWDVLSVLPKGVKRLWLEAADT